MLRELAHFFRNAPGTLRLKSKLPQPEFYQVLIDRADAAGLADQRAPLVGDLRGEILELGSGTGSMFSYYGRDARVTALEPDAAFSALSHERARTADATITVSEGRGEELPFASASFDAAVLSLVLCSVESVATVVGELHRVLRPGGKLRLIEHVRSEKAVAGWLMDRVDGIWLRLNAQGCHLDRNPLPHIEEAGFTIEAVTPFQVFSAGIPAFPMRRIHALR